MTIHGSIVAYNGAFLTIKPEGDISRELLKKSVKDVEIRLNDGRTITNDQRRMIYAFIADFAKFTGYEPDEAKAWLKFFYIRDRGGEFFSLSDVDMTTAKEFIDYLVNFFFEQNIPTRSPLRLQTDDIGKYLYRCLEHRKCAICNAPADVHHVDAVGMGRNRETINHLGLRAIALCRQHHQEAHQRGRAFFDYYHVYGIRLDEYLCDVLGLKKS